MKIFRRGDGFTLIEVLIVVGLIGVMIAGLIIIINPAAQLARGRDSQRKSDLKTYQQALELYRADNNFYPSYNGAANSLNLSSGGVVYLRTPPTDPKGANCGYAYSGNGGTYTISTILEYTSDPAIGGPYSSSGCGSGFNYQVLSP